MSMVLFLNMQWNMQQYIEYVLLTNRLMYFIFNPNCMIMIKGICYVIESFELMVIDVVDWQKH